MKFLYTARDAMGRNLEGAVDAETPELASQSLRRDGFTVVSLEEDDSESGLFPRSISKNEVIYATSQLAIMVDTGITLSVALGSIGSQSDNPTVRSLFLDLKSKVEAGEDFSSALAEHPRVFDTTYVSLVRASEQTGTLGEMLDRIAHYLRKELETKAKVRGAMAYPGVMALVALGVTIFLLTYILPQFEPLFSRKGMKLPQITVLLMGTSKFLLKYWIAWMSGSFVAVAAVLYFRRTPIGRKFFDQLKLNMPVIGPLVRKVTISRSIRTLGTMVKAGVSVLDALRLCAEISGNYFYHAAWMKVVDAVTEGNRISDSLQGSNLFPRTLVQMIASGEDTGKLDYVLEKVSDFYDSEVDTSIKTATSLIEPLMITGMGVVVGGIAMGLLLPIFQLSRPG